MSSTSTSGTQAGAAGSMLVFATKRRSDSYWGIVFGELKRNRGAMIGAGVLLFLIAVAVAAPVIAPYDPIKMYPEGLEPPGAKYWLGTDNFGRDMFSRIVFGTRISLTVGLISVSIGAIAGIVLGLLAGYFGGHLDNVIMRMIDALLAFPEILLALAIMVTLGTSLTNVMIAVGISSVPRYTRVVRGSVLSAKENLYVEAARAVGCGSLKIMFSHLLPNIFGPLVVLATLGIASAILLAAGLGYLGLGAQPPTPEWGLLLSSGRNYLAVAWWVTTFPGLAIMVTVLAINMLGDGLRDALDPRLQRN
jgi:peptide/nickel transport system permease protein